MNYPTLAEALLIAAATVGIDAKTLRLISRVDLLDSALYAPQATFDGIDLYEDFHTKAAVLCRSIAMNHPLLDGNKRLAWQLLDYFCEVNGYVLVSTTNEAVDLMLSLAAGSIAIEELIDWIRSHATLITE